MDLPNRRLFDCFEARVALAIEFRKYRPQVVIGFGDKTRARRRQAEALLRRRPRRVARLSNVLTAIGRPNSS